MLRQLLYIVLFISLSQLLHSQEDGVVAYALPVRNSLMFNKHTINPTFSFVREQNKYISFTNKREWVQFDNAPQTNLFSYSGRFGENTGVGISLFQQNYGVLTTFGGVLNYAQNVVLDRDSNLTFGLNLGFYKSGINEGNVVTNIPDPSLENMSSNMIFSVAPGINYGTTFFDFGVSLNNLVAYNLKTSKIIEENPEQSVQTHVMYTGYVDSRGFFDKSKFSGLLRSEFKKEQTVISSILMLTIPKGLWGQVGYNTLYGLSGGVGLNITSQIAIEYNFEKAMGNLSTFGSSHEVTLAYKFSKRQRYNYSDDDDQQALFSNLKTNKKVLANSKNMSTTKVDRAAIAEAKAQAKAEALAKLEAKKQARLKSIEVTKTKQVTENKIEETTTIDSEKITEEARIKQAQVEKAKAEEVKRIKLAQEVKAKIEAEARIKQAQEEKAKIVEANRIKLAQEAKAKADEEARIKLVQEEKEKVAEANKIKLAQEAKAKADEEARIKQEELDAALIKVPTDATGIAISNLTELATNSKIEQEDLLIKLEETVANRQKELKDLKQENDLSEQGIYSEPKAFKSVTAENAALESLKVQIDDVIKSQEIKITELENLYKQRLKSVPDKEDSVNMIYLNEILIIKKAQAKAKRTKESLVAELETIKVATEFERKRRIKRAAYDNEQDRYDKDRAALNQIKQFTEQSSVPFKAEDFDFGEKQTDNIQIIKDIKNTEIGYYLVVAVHNDVAKRDEFLRKAVAAGQNNIDFFFDVATNKYYIYYEKYDDINEARNGMNAKGSKPYNGKMSMIKIEN